MVSRQAMEYSDGTKWCYCCTCNSMRAKDISACRNKSHLTCTEFLSLYPNCVHAKALHAIVEDEMKNDYVDSDMQPVDASDILIPIPFDSTKYVFKGRQGFTVVAGRDRKIYCFLCSCHYSCTHVKELKALHQVPEVLEFIQGVESTTVYRERAIAVVSEDNICFQIAVEEQVVYSNPPTELFESVGGVLQLIPPTKATCGCGATTSQTPVVDGQPLLFCSTAVVRAQSMWFPMLSP
ncbi:uncharacterized protein LOC121690318 [Alosa sapidissima]|uniref:uncharacterized protein LOC121690318 n=1 Tax=Alosa sapidissima TaxID=34773 RepID=UPI001C084596|nr:uncharacterized protein LOC121690318 [Alosa sapidissima]